VNVGAQSIMPGKTGPLIQFYFFPLLSPPFIHLFIHSFLSILFFLLVYLIVCWLCLCVCLFVCLSVCLFLFVCLFLCRQTCRVFRGSDGVSIDRKVLHICCILSSLHSLCWAVSNSHQVRILIPTFNSLIKQLSCYKLFVFLIWN